VAWGPLNRGDTVGIDVNTCLGWVGSRGVGWNASSRRKERMEKNLNNWRGNNNGKEGRDRLEVYGEEVLYNNIILNTSHYKENITISGVKGGVNVSNNKDNIINKKDTDNNINSIKLSNVYFAGPITLNNLSNPSLASLQLISQTTYRSSQKVHGRYKDRIGLWPSTASIWSIWFGKVMDRCMVCVCGLLELFGVVVPSYSEFRYRKERNENSKEVV